MPGPDWDQDRDFLELPPTPKESFVSKALPVAVGAIIVGADLLGLLS
jgi:hypothetical protein